MPCYVIQDMGVHANTWPRSQHAHQLVTPPDLRSSLSGAIIAHLRASLLSAFSTSLLYAALLCRTWWLVRHVASWTSSPAAWGTRDSCWRCCASRQRCRARHPSRHRCACANDANQRMARLQTCCCCCCAVPVHSAMQRTCVWLEVLAAFKVCTLHTQKLVSLMPSCLLCTAATHVLKLTGAVLGH